MATAHQLGLPLRPGRDHVRGSREDSLSGLESGIAGKPTLFINNVRHVGAHDVGSLIEATEPLRSLPAGALPGSGVGTQ